MNGNKDRKVPEADAWPNGATVKLESTTIYGTKVGNVQWAYRDGSGQLMSIISRMPIDPLKYSVVEERKMSEMAIDGIGPASRQKRKPSSSTLQALLVAKRGSDLDMLIVRLQKQTHEAYAQYGVGAEQYEQPFDDLHWCRMVRMALDFRAARGLPPDASTPYDDADLAVWLDEVRNLPLYDLAATADQAFKDYDFGNGVVVTDTSGWEYFNEGFERSRQVYVETEQEDDGPAPRATLTFTVRLNREGSLSEAYAKDGRGQIWGSMPDRKMSVFTLTNDDAHFEQEKVR